MQKAWGVAKKMTQITAIRCYSWRTFFTGRPVSTPRLDKAGPALMEEKTEEW